MCLPWKYFNFILKSLHLGEKERIDKHNQPTSYNEVVSSMCLKPFAVAGDISHGTYADSVAQDWSDYFMKHICEH